MGATVNRASFSAFLAVAVVLLGMGWGVNHYRMNAMNYKEQRDRAAGERNKAEATIRDMVKRQHDVAALDMKYTKELADAKQTIEQLQRDVAAGAKRLHINATCKPVSKTTSSTSLDDATSPGLTDAAQRDYFRLRKRLGEVNSMIAGLQNYIRSQCL